MPCLIPGLWLVLLPKRFGTTFFCFPSTHGIKDVDIIYFDADDLSEASEAEHSARIRAAFSGLPVWIDLKNQARVHSWYETKFGYPINPYTSTAEAIAAFPTIAAAIGLRPGHADLEMCAPYGVSDLLSAIVRPNKKQITREIYESKINRWTKLWPGLVIVGWDQ